MKKNGRKNRIFISIFIPFLGKFFLKCHTFFSTLAIPRGTPKKSLGLCAEKFMAPETIYSIILCPFSFVFPPFSMKLIDEMIVDAIGILNKVILLFGRVCWFLLLMVLIGVRLLHSCRATFVKIKCSSCSIWLLNNFLLETKSRSLMFWTGRKTEQDVCLCFLSRHKEKWLRQPVKAKPNKKYNKQHYNIIQHLIHPSHTFTRPKTDPLP